MPPTTLPISSVPIDPVAPPAVSALDDLPPALKLNAVAEALARRHDHSATLRLLAEMSASDIALDPSTQAAILDSAVSDPPHLASLLARISPTGFGTLPNPPLRPPCAAPDPSRALDLSLAGSFLFVVSTAVSAEFVEPALLHRDPVEPTAMLLFMLAALAFDRYVTSATVWARVRAGMVRLFSDDPARAARVDAAAFLTAYLLGLPWLCFRPDGTRALRDTNDPTDPAFVDRVLLWLVAGPAVEDALDGRLIQTDLRPARDFLWQARMARPPQHRWPAAEAEDRLRRAVASAAHLLESHRTVLDALARAMLDGASVGECVSLLSARYASQ